MIYLTLINDVHHFQNDLKKIFVCLFFDLFETADLQISLGHFLVIAAVFY